MFINNFWISKAHFKKLDTRLKYATLNHKHNTFLTYSAMVWAKINRDLKIEAFSRKYSFTLIFLINCYRFLFPLSFFVFNCYYWTYYKFFWIRNTQIYRREILDKQNIGKIYARRKVRSPKKLCDFIC